MKILQTIFLAGVTALFLPGAGAAPGVALSGPAAPAAIAPAISQWSLGLVVDGRRTGDQGVLVVAVSPQGAAERMGVQAGDRLLAINGESLVGVPASGEVFERAVAASDGEARLEVAREGAPMTLTGHADGMMAAGAEVASQNHCGYVSADGAPPRVSRNIYQAEITQINGESTPLRPLNRYQLPTGRNVLVVREHIDRHHISRGDTRRIDRMQSRDGARAYKVLVVDVEPDTRYSVGAELLPDQMDPDSIRANAWWQPVVWESRAETCR